MREPQLELAPGTGVEPGKPRPGRDAGFDLALLAFTLLPFLLTAHLPLSDLPNHLARQHILANWSASTALQEYYRPHFGLMPNLAFDLFMQGMRHLVPLELAARLFCMAAVALLFLGVRTVGLRLDPGARFYRAAPLLIYGGPLQFGFLSFCFATGAALILLGVWLKRRDDPLHRLLLVFLPAAFLLIALHLAAFVVFALTLGAFELSAALARREGVAGTVRRQLRLAAFLVPPFGVVQLAGAGSGSHPVVFSTVQQKLDSIVAITVFSSPAIELALLALAGAGFLLALAARAIRPHPAVWCVVPVLVAVWLAAPRSAAGGGYVDYRLPWVIALLLLAMTVRGSRWTALARPLATTFLGLAGARVLLISWLWLAWEPVIAEIDTAFSRLPAGARLMVVQGDLGSISASRRPPLLHVAAYAVLRRDAFEPQLYASIPGQTIDFSPRWLGLRKFTSPGSLQHIDPAYTHLLVIDPDHARLAPDLPLVELAAGRRFALHAIAPSGSQPR